MGEFGLDFRRFAFVSTVELSENVVGLCAFNSCEDLGRFGGLEMEI